MSILSDAAILAKLGNGSLKITPFDQAYLQPNSYDIHLHPEILWFNGNEPDRPLDPEEDCSWAMTYANLLDGGRDSLIMPDTCMLARTVEWFEFSDDLAGRIEGVSTNGRLFLKIHVTAGFFDAGFRGTATLEIKNEGPRPIVIRSGMRIGQISFEELTSPSFNPYGSRNRYQNQVDATPARPLGSSLVEISEPAYGTMGDLDPRDNSGGDESARPQESVVQSLYAGRPSGGRIRKP